MSSEAPPAAHRVPPELFKRIIDHLIPEVTERISLAEVADIRKQSKREAGRCSLVCRYWAWHCRAPIFEHIKLRFLEETLPLIEFTRNSTLGVRVGTFVLTIVLEVVLPSDPWVHLIMNTVSRAAFPNLERLSLKFVGATTCSQDRPHLRTVFGGLPRSLPSPELSAAATVRLENVDFPSFAHLVTFIDSVVPPRPIGSGHATVLTLSNTRWGDTQATVPSEAPVPFRARRRSWKKPVYSLSISGCAMSWPLAWLMVATEHPKPSSYARPPYVHIAEMCRLATLVSMIMDTCKCVMCRIPPAFNTNFVVHTVEDGSHELEVTNNIHSLTFSFLRTGFISQIRFDFAAIPVKLPRDQPVDAIAFDWTALMEQVTAFPDTLHNFCIQIPEAVYDDYDPYVRARVPNVGAGGRLALTKKLHVNKKALLVGIRYSAMFPAALRRRASHGDVDLIRELLINTCGFGSENITVLKDDVEVHNPTYPNREHILRGLEDLLSDVQADDHLFLLFSGHGSQKAAVDHGSEADGMDEVIWPADAVYHENSGDVENVILDDDVRKMLVDRIPKGAHLTLLFDCSSPSNVIDLPFTNASRDDAQSRADDLSVPRTLTISPVDDVDSDGEQPDESTTSTQHASPAAPLAKPVVVSWSASEETPNTLPLGNTNLVRAFVAALEDNRDATHEELLHSITLTMRAASGDGLHEPGHSVSGHRRRPGPVPTLAMLSDSERILHTSVARVLGAPPQH